MIGVGGVRRVWWAWVDGKAGCGDGVDRDVGRGAVVKSVFWPRKSRERSMAAAVTPTDLNVWRPKMGERRTRFIHTQRTIGVGCTLMKTNKTDSALIYFRGCSKGATGKLRARARARAQPGLLLVELLVCACGRRATKNTGDTAVRARALKGRVLRKKRKCHTQA